MKCSYGCGNEGLYKFKNGKLCCEPHFTKCPSIRKKNSRNQIGKKTSSKTKEKQSKSHKKRYTKKLRKIYSERMKKRYKDPNERKKQKEIALKIWSSKEFREKHKNALNKYFDNRSKFTLEQYRIKYPTFSKVENLRYKPNTKKIQVKCKKCDNWFIPTCNQLSDRIIQIEHLDGNDGCYFYCSNDCKYLCPLYNIHSDPYKNTEKPYTLSEYQTFRTFVLERDDYKCQFCGEKATDVHHERPQKLEPFFALDPDFAWSCCKECHFKYGHQDECSTGNLAKIVC
jgi:hypothetical protein